MTNRSRARWSLAVALGAHALAMAWTLGLRHTTAERARDAHAEASEIEVVVEPPAAASPAPPPPAELPPAEDLCSRTSRRVASLSNRALPSAPAPLPATVPSIQEESVPPVASVEPRGDRSWTFSPTRPSAQTGEGGQGSDSTSALGRATAAGIGAVLAEAEKKAEDRARKPLVFTTRDMDLGVVPGGQYTSIARDRVRNSLVPLESHALLEFWTDKRGVVARVRVLQASSDPRAWDDVADALAEDARTTFPLKIPSNADGLIVTLDVRSVLRTLSGAVPSRNPIVKALGALTNPVDAILDSKAPAQRVVAARVVSVEAF